MDILALPGSLRRASCNRRLLMAAAELAPPGMTLQIWNEMGSIPLYDEDLERETNGGPEPVRRLRSRLAEADGLLIATPEYNHSVPGVLKNTIDWLSRPGPEEPLAGKPVAIIGATRGRWGTRLAQSALRQVLYSTESLVLPSPALFLANASNAFDEDGRLVDEQARRNLGALLSAFQQWIERVTGQADRPS